MEIKYTHRYVDTCLKHGFVYNLENETLGSQNIFVFMPL